MSDFDYRSSWKDDARSEGRKKNTTPKSKPCPKCGTYSHRRFGDPCPYCFYMDSNEQRQYYEMRRWNDERAQQRREDALLNRILEKQ